MTHSSVFLKLQRTRKPIQQRSRIIYVLILIILSQRISGKRQHILQTLIRHPAIRRRLHSLLQNVQAFIEKLQILSDRYEQK